MAWETRKERVKATKNTNPDFNAFNIVKKISMRQTSWDLKISLKWVVWATSATWRWRCTRSPCMSLNIQKKFSEDSFGLQPKQLFFIIIVWALTQSTTHSLLPNFYFFFFLHILSPPFTHFFYFSLLLFSTNSVIYIQTGIFFTEPPTYNIFYDQLTYSL